jgi:hypothetical protein
MEMTSIYKSSAENAAGAATAGATAGGILGGLISSTTNAVKPFGQALADAQDKLQESQDKRAAEARKAAEGLVAHALILPMLKQLRHSTFNENGLFSPGNGEKAFGPEFDMEIADRIARSPKMTLTAALTERLQARRPVQMTPAITKGVDLRG